MYSAHIRDLVMMQMQQSFCFLCESIASSNPAYTKNGFLNLNMNLRPNYNHKSTLHVNVTIVLKKTCPPHRDEKFMTVETFHPKIKIK